MKGLLFALLTALVLACSLQAQVTYVGDYLQNGFLRLDSGTINNQFWETVSFSQASGSQHVKLLKLSGTIQGGAPSGCTTQPGVGIEFYDTSGVKQDKIQRFGSGSTSTVFTLNAEIYVNPPTIYSVLLLYIPGSGCTASTALSFNEVLEYQLETGYDYPFSVNVGWRGNVSTQTKLLSATVDNTTSNNFNETGFGYYNFTDLPINSCSPVSTHTFKDGSSQHQDILANLSAVGFGANGASVPVNAGTAASAFNTFNSNCLPTTVGYLQQYYYRTGTTNSSGPYYMTAFLDPQSTSGNWSGTTDLEVITSSTTMAITLDSFR